MKKFTKSGWMTMSMLLLFFGGAFAQGTFQKTFGGPGIDSGRDFVICSNGDYLVVGSSTSYSAGHDSDIYISRTTPTGDEIWHKTYGMAGQDMAWNVNQLSDGNFIVAGCIDSADNLMSDMILLKINGAGDIIWSKTYGTTGRDEAKEAIEVSDGIIISGYTAIPGSQDVYKCTLLKTDLSGNMLWMKQYAVTENLFLGGGYSVKPTPDGGYVYFGQTHGTDFANTDYYLLKVDGSGTEQWSKVISQPMPDRGQYVWVNSDGSIMTIGDQQNGSAGDYDVNVRKFDSAGNEQWSKLYGGDQKDIGKRILPTHDGGYLAAGITRSFGLINPDFYVIKLDGNGNMEWSKTYGGSNHEHCYKAIETGSYFVALGHSLSFSSYADIFLVKDNMQQATTNVVTAGQRNISIYPNPATAGILQITGLQAQSSRVHILDMLGRTVLTSQYEGGQPLSLDVSGLARGVYSLSLVNGDTQVNSKIVIQ